MSETLIALARPLPETFQDALATLGDLVIAAPAELGPSGQCPDIVVVTPFDTVDAETVAGLPACVRLIASIGVGIDHVDLAAAAARGIHVSNTPVVTEDTADLAWALILAASRRTTQAEHLLREGLWAKASGQMGSRVHSKTLGIVGFGAIGQAVARRASGFGMDILYHSPHEKATAAGRLGATYCPTLEELLSKADIISLHCPLTEATQHVMNRGTFARMKEGAIFINTGRGRLVHEQALVEALETGRLGAAGLDVYEFEPSVTPALLTLQNVTLLPHIGSATHECRTDMALRCIANIRQQLATGMPADSCLPA